MRPRSTDPRNVGYLPLNDEFDLTKLYTYFGHEEKKPKDPGGTAYPLLKLNNASYPRLPAYWLDPAKYLPTPPTIANTNTKYTPRQQHQAASPRRHPRPLPTHPRLLRLLTHQGTQTARLDLAKSPQPHDCPFPRGAVDGDEGRSRV